MKRKYYAWAIISIIILLFVIVGCSKTHAVRPIYEAGDTAIEIESLHFTWTQTTSWGYTRSADGYLDSDHAKFVWYENESKVVETRQIGDDTYAWSSGTDEWIRLDKTRVDLPLMGPLLYYMYEPGRISGMLNNRLDNVQILADESINGVKCAHYRGDAPVLNIKEAKELAETETDPNKKEFYEQRVERLEKKIIDEEISEVWDIWIDTHDYVVRQIVITYSNKLLNDSELNGTMVSAGTKITTTLAMEYFNYNQLIEIVAPL